MSTVTAASTIAARTRAIASAISGRGHRLAADVEADAERVGGLAGGHQQRLHVARVGAELGGEAELRMIGADADADEEVEVGRCDAVSRGRANDLLELLDRVEAEGPHAMLEIGFGDRLLGLHRVHEAEHRLGQRLVDEPNLADRSDVIVRNAGVPQDLEQVGRRVRLDRVERAAGELLDEEAGGPTRGVRTQQASPARPVGAWR